MLKRLAERHGGSLPLSTVEHVWREIIGTFTQAQARFKVHAPQASDPAVRDLLRFHFGFSAELVGHDTAEAAIAACAASGTPMPASRSSPRCRCSCRPATSASPLPSSSARA